VARKLEGQRLQLGGCRQPPLPEKEGDLFEGHLLGEVRDDVALVDEAAVFAVDHRDRGL
jgi:hypothetical protein